MPDMIIAGHVTESPGIYPLVPVSGMHTLLVVLAYSIIFVIETLAFTRWRDVRE